MICPLWALWVLTDVAAAFRSPLLELLFDHLHHLIGEMNGDGPFIVTLCH